MERMKTLGLLILLHSVKIRTCDVYEVPRNSLGIYWDYVYFDADGNLVGFHRRFVD